MKITIDSREPEHIKKELPQYFMENVREPFEFEVQELPAGDFRCDNILIERKEINDFYSSIIDHRYSTQKIKLAEQVAEGTHTYVLIHGSMDDLYNMSMTPRMYSGAVASLTESGINVLHIPSTKHEYVYEMIYAIIRKYDPNKVLSEPFIRPKVDNYAQKCLMCIDGIGEETAKNIIDNYSTRFDSFYQRDPEKLKNDLIRVEGVGFRTAEKIINTLYGRRIL